MDARDEPANAFFLPQLAYVSTGLGGKPGRRVVYVGRLGRKESLDGLARYGRQRRSG